MTKVRSGDDGSQWLLVIVLATIYTWALVDRFLLALLVDPIKDDLHLTDVQVSTTVGLAFSLSYGLVSLPAGMLTDRVGRRGLVGGAAACWSIATAFCGFATGFVHLFVARAGVGIAEAFISPASLSLIRDRVGPAVRGRAFSMFAMGPNVGGAIALAGGGGLLAAAQAGAFSGLPVLGALHPWQVVLIVTGLAGLLPILLLLLLRPDTPGARRSMDDATAFPGRATFLAYLSRNRVEYALLVGYVTCAAMLAFSINAWMPAMMSRKFGLSLVEIGVVSGPLTLVSIVAGLGLCGIVMDRIARRNGEVLWYGIAAGIGATGASVMLTLVADATLAWIAYGVTIFFMGSFYAVGVTTLARITPGALMGRTTALYLIFQSSLGGALAPTIAAAWATLFAGPTAIAHGLMIHCATMGVASLILCGALIGRLRGARAGGADGLMIADAV